MFLPLHALTLACAFVTSFCSAQNELLPLASMRGTVRDADGKPIAGANVSLWGTEGYVETRMNTKGNGRAKSDKDGKYELFVFTQPDAKIIVHGVRAEASGFVILHKSFPSAPPVLLPAKSTVLDLTLAPGEVLAGKAEMPLTIPQRRRGEKPEDQHLFFNVKGPSFQQSFMTRKGGEFEVWVPKGTYTLELVAATHGVPLAQLEKVASGTRGLRLVGVEPVIVSATLAIAFDALWDDMDRNYSYFTLKKVDWKALKGRYRPKAIAGETLSQFIEAINDMLAELRDGHVWIKSPNGDIGRHIHPQAPINYNRKATLAGLEDVSYCGDFAVVGKTKGDGFGAFVMTWQSAATAESVKVAIERIRSFKDAPGFVIDLRDANGGNELLAQEIAKQFCAAPTIYAKSKYRAGPGHNDFGPTYDRVLKASENPITKPVVCLLGPRCVSSGEAFAKMMKCLPHVTTVGQRTRGSSGNPREFKLPAVPVSVFYSRWVDMMPDGSPVEGVGVVPAVELSFPPADYENRDPTWEHALTLLRKKVGK